MLLVAAVAFCAPFGDESDAKADVFGRGLYTTSAVPRERGGTGAGGLEGT